MADIGSNGSMHQVTLTLSYTPATSNLKIVGEVDNLDMAINMCQQALRELETQHRQAKAIAFQEQLKQSAASRDIAAMLSRTRGH